MLKFIVDVSQDKGKLVQAGVGENILINHADTHTLSLSRLVGMYCLTFTLLVKQQADNLTAL